jgi:hypothetical protein
MMNPCKNKLKILVSVDYWPRNIATDHGDGVGDDEIAEYRELAKWRIILAILLNIQRQINF